MDVKPPRPRLEQASRTPPAGRGVRVGLPLLLCAALVAVEIVRGTQGARALEARHRADLVALIRRQQERLARDVEEMIGQAEGHALFLARSPAVLDLLRAPGADAEAAAERALLPYLASFRGLDRVTVLDGQGFERARCERMGAGVAAIPAALRDPAARADLLALARTARPGEVRVSGLALDAERVEVAAADRQVMHFVAPAPGGAEEGAVAVTAYAAPLLHRLKGFLPLAGTVTFLLDAKGEAFAAPDLDPAAPSLAAARLALAGEDAAQERELDGALVLATPLAHGPAALMVSAVPSAALAAASGPSLGERLRAGSVTLLVLLAIAVASALFVRQGARAARLREAEAYLARLSDEARRYRALIEASADVLLVLEPGVGRVRDWNQPAGRLFDLGDPPRDGAGDVALERVLSAFAPEGAASLREALDAALSAPGAAVQRAGLALARADAGGPPSEVDARCVALEYAGARLVEVALVDRTREREMERRVQTAERLGSLGLFTAGVAHEINNPLEGLGNYVALLERADADPERRAHHLRQVRAGLDRIRAIVGDLLRFARTAPDQGEADLALAVESALSLARYTQHLASVEVERRGLERALWVRGGAVRIEQVLLNLLLNAGRAMDGRGKVTLAAARGGDGWVELTVQDRGPGIAPEDLPRIFDPFFSRSGGTGLGLAVSYGIVRAIGGELSAHNLAGGGACFVLRLPPASQANMQEDVLA